MAYGFDDNKNKVEIGGNNLGAQVTLNNTGGYLSEDNMYTFPADGYVDIFTTKTGANGCAVRVYGATTTTVSISRYLWQDSKKAPIGDCFFVRKGMRAYCTAPKTSGITVSYSPLQ